MLTYKLRSRASDVNLFEKGKKYILNAYDLENKCGMLDGKKQVCYVTTFRDVLKIGWLAINERRDLDLQKSCFKAFYNTEA